MNSNNKKLSIFIETLIQGNKEDEIKINLFSTYFSNYDKKKYKINQTLVLSVLEKTDPHFLSSTSTLGAQRLRKHVKSSVIKNMEDIFYNAHIEI